MKVNPILRLIILFMVAAGTFAGCSAPASGEEDKTSSSTSDSASPASPVVTDDNGQLLFSWFEENTGKTATDIAEIPESVKKEVRVQDLSVPPDKRNPDWLFLANLTVKDAAGNYAVKAVRRDQYEEKRHPRQPETQKTADQSASMGNGVVLMYSTAGCPHCKRARRWLLEQKIPYKEFDIEKDDVAAKELYEKCQAQSIMPGGVPMFDVNGQIVPGFSPEAILQLLKQPVKTAPSAAPAPAPIQPAQPVAPPVQQNAPTMPQPSPGTGMTI